MRKSEAGAVLLSPLGVREALMRRHVWLGGVTLVAARAPRWRASRTGRETVAATRERGERGAVRNGAYPSSLPARFLSLESQGASDAVSVCESTGSIRRGGGGALLRW